MRIEDAIVLLVISNIVTAIIVWFLVSHFSLRLMTKILQDEGIYPSDEEMYGTKKN